MDFNIKPILAGAGGLIIGALIGIGIGSSGKSALEAEVETQRAVVENVGTLSETVDQRIGALEQRLGSVESSVATLGEAQTGRIEALSQRIEGLGSDIGGKVSGLGSSVADSLSGRFDALKSDLAAVGERLSAAPSGDAPEAATPEAAAAPAAAPAAPAAAPGGEVVQMGSAITLADGGLRVFLSAIDEAGGSARVAINGPTTSTLKVGEPFAAGDCTLTLTGFAEGGAAFDGSCGAAPADQGAAAPAAAPQTAAETAAAPAAAAPVGEPLAIGAAATYADGKMRIFLSGVDQEAMTARVALNGVTMMQLRLSEPAEAAGCQVTLTGIDATGASFDVTC